MLVLSNADVEKVLDIRSVMDALDLAYRDLAENRATNVPRVDSLAEHAEREDAVHAFKTMSSSYPRGGVAALRLNSDIIAWPRSDDGGIRRTKLAVSGEQGLYNGGILLFSTVTGELLAIMSDGVVQRMRVGATNGLALRHLARSDARTVALLGSGWQAGTQLSAVAEALPITQVRVFSPSQENRERFVASSGPTVDAEVMAASSAEEAVDGADIIMLSTNALTPVFKESWLVPGVTVTTIRGPELPRTILRRFDRVIVHQHEMVRAFATDEARRRSPEFHDGEYGAPDAGAFDLSEQASLIDVLSDPTRGRANDGETVAFHNFVGMGLQFAAVGAVVLERAREAGLGHEVPTEWFLQDVHP